ncbi:hypothetical protein C8J56DRAFT_1168347 [Mycena floridula]|nr:hypothetical protein C8J56DRAFT_1168347 [Mycena floridula]
MLSDPLAPTCSMRGHVYRAPVDTVEYSATTNPKQNLPAETLGLVIGQRESHRPGHDKDRRFLRTAQSFDPSSYFNWIQCDLLAENPVSESEDYYPFLKSLREVDQIRALIVTHCSKPRSSTSKSNGCGSSG